MASIIKKRMVKRPLFYWDCPQKGCKVHIENWVEAILIRNADSHMTWHRTRAEKENKLAIAVSRLSAP
jgi:RNA polymerase subunit RPABC4/transcription elongation factor Spt4